MEAAEAEPPEEPTPAEEEAEEPAEAAPAEEPPEPEEKSPIALAPRTARSLVVRILGSLQ